MLTPDLTPGEEMGHVEEIQGSPGFGAKVKAHLRRFWWLHLFIFVACTLIIVLCLSVTPQLAFFPGKLANGHANGSTEFTSPSHTFHRTTSMTQASQYSP